MKTRNIIVLAVLAALPVAGNAAPADDRRIEEQAKSSFNFRRALDEDVDIKVRDGVATLTGEVRGESDRRLAEDTVAGFRGVTRVENQIRVDPNAGGSRDEWLAMKIRARLAVKANVSMTNTDVSVRDGEVILAGRADSQAQKELTEAYIKDIDGVKSVKNELRVIEPTREPARLERDPMSREPRDTRDDRGDHATVGERIDDGSITAQIKYELFAHRSTSGLKTTVNTNHGHVVISGHAGSQAEKDLVTQLAKSIRGVVDVDNNMTVAPR